MGGAQAFGPAGCGLSPVDAKRRAIQRSGTGDKQRWRPGPANVFWRCPCPPAPQMLSFNPAQQQKVPFVPSLGWRQVSGDTFGSLLSAQSHAQGLPAGPPSPGVPLSASPGSSNSLCAKHRFQKGGPTWVQFWPSHKQATQLWAKDLSQPPFFQL